MFRSLHKGSACYFLTCFFSLDFVSPINKTYATRRSHRNEHTISDVLVSIVLTDFI